MRVGIDTAVLGAKVRTPWMAKEAKLDKQQNGSYEQRQRRRS